MSTSSKIDHDVNSGVHNFYQERNEWKVCLSARAKILALRIYNIDFKAKKSLLLSDSNYLEEANAYITHQHTDIIDCIRIFELK